MHSVQRLQQAATRAAFFVPGFVIATWAPIVPFAKQRAALDEAALGLVLLCLGLGSLAAMPLAGALTARHGCRRVMATAAAVMLAVLPLLTLVTTAWSLGAVLLAFGAAIGAMDCAMNIQAVAVERESGRPMMSGFHAFYSIGSLAGAALATLLLTLGLPALTVALVIAATTAAITLPALRGWRTQRAPQGRPAFALPRGVVAVIGVVCFVTFLAEGSMLDWSAVFMHEARGVDRARAGWGFVAFNLAMTTMRLAGDRTIARFGRASMVLAGGLVASVGLLAATLVPSPLVTLAGYVLLGMGCANIVPAMFTLAGAQRRMPDSLAVPAITTMGYAGVLAGPAMIGFVAQATSLVWAFVLVAVVLAAAAIAGARIRSER